MRTPSGLITLALTRWPWAVQAATASPTASNASGAGRRWKDGKVCAHSGAHTKSTEAPAQIASIGCNVINPSPALFQANRGCELSHLIPGAHSAKIKNLFLVSLLSTMEWDQLRHFLAVVRTGSLSKA